MRTPAAVLALGALAVTPVPRSSPAAAQAEPVPVVLELFTSQGCSSCPPADQLLSRLGAPGDAAGQGGAAPAKVLALAFHVDYWNRLGWKDPFSSAAWSARQERYASAFRSNRIYTPQLVVGGREECVGSRADQVQRLIAAAAATPPAARLKLAVERPTDGSGLRVTVAATPDTQGAAAPDRSGGAGARPPRGSYDLWVALTESGLTTPVGAGENARLTLRNDHVVRRLERAATLPFPPPAPGRATAERSAQVVLPLDKKWDPAHLEVVAFLQDRASLAIAGAAAAPVPAR